MNSADEIKRLFKEAELSVNSDADEKVFEDIQIARQKSEVNMPAAPVSIGRILMKSPIIKIAVAAVITIACLTGVFMFNRTSGVALADVLNQIEQISVYMYQMSMSMSGQMVVGQPVDQEMNVKILVSHDYGMKMTTDVSSPVGGENILQEMYMLPQKKAMIIVMPSQKRYMQMDLDDQMVKQTQQQNNDPRLMIKQILECKYESLGISTIDGIEAEGFQTSDPNYLGGMMGGQVDVKIWVDVATQLPVLSEMDMQIGEIQMHAVMHDFQWDVTVDAAEFEPVIPEDYTAITNEPIKMPAFDEQTAVRGLELYAELTGGYPEELNLMNIISKTSEAMGSKLVEDRVQQDNQDISEQERVKELTEKIMPITGLVSFYMKLVQDKNEPAYYGEFVTPGDTDKVLMRWKVSENEYRVIFGDLQAETVDTDVLAELESALPQ
jgi:outer membrane lipoprotein-sorting protein